MRHVAQSLFALAALCLCTAAVAGEKSAVTFNFDSDKPGDPPKGFDYAKTGQGAEGKWVVRAEQGSPNNHVLVQESADPTDYRFPLAVVKEGSYKDVTLSARARPVSGEVDQGFGLVKKVLDATDDTFKDAGKVGLWTKADSVIQFDDLTITPKQERQRRAGPGTRPPSQR